MGRNYAIDFVKGIGLLLVAALHITIFGQFHWAANWIVNTGMRFVVPFFFLASGYFLFMKLKKSGNRQEILGRYALRILKYYLIGFVICYCFDYFVLAPLWKMPEVFFRGYMSGSFWSDFLYYGLCHMSGFHLWFLLAMFWAALVILLVCRKDIHKIKFVFWAALFLHAVGLFGMTQPYSRFFAMPMFPRDALFFSLFYMSLGGMWALGGVKVEKYLPEKYSVWIIAGLFILQLAERSLLIIGVPWGEYWGEYFITTVPLTMALFQYALVNGQKFKNNIFTRVGEKSVGVYILHAIAINITYTGLHYIGAEIQQNPLLQIGQVFVIIALAYIFYVAFLKAYAGGKRLFSAVIR